ncbi:MAG: tol-pal system-associated acyl-CoA thioesterase [Paracoccaceae bacterium]
MSHVYNLRVYYEDTDLAGIVYYANYLKFIERARTEWVREIGIDQTRLKQEHDLVFAVRRVEADFAKPAKFDDQLSVRTDLVSASGARLTLAQDVLRDGDVLFSSSVTLVCLTKAGRPTRLPAEIRHLFVVEGQ